MCYESNIVSSDIFNFDLLVVVDGQIKRLKDEDIQSNVLEITGPNIQSTYITCPVDPAATLGIKLPFLVMMVKNVKKYFSFEIQILDDKNVRRRFRASNFQVYEFAILLFFCHQSAFFLFCLSKSPLLRIVF